MCYYNFAHIRLNCVSATYYSIIVHYVIGQII